jgi:hypothetical protein
VADQAELDKRRDSTEQKLGSPDLRGQSKALRWYWLSEIHALPAVHKVRDLKLSTLRLAPAVLDHSRTPLPQSDGDTRPASGYSALLSVASASSPSSEVSR